MNMTLFWIAAPYSVWYTFSDVSEGLAASVITIDLKTVHLWHKIDSMILRTMGLRFYHL